MNTLALLTFIGLFAVLLACLAAVFFSWQAYRSSHGGGMSDQTARLFQQQLENLRSGVSETLTAQTQTFNQQFDRITTQVNLRLEEVSRGLTDSQKSVGDRLDNAARVVGEVQKSLGELGQASERIFEVGKDIAGLQEILRAPKLRGGLGEFFLADLLSQILPAKHYRTQHTFKTGNTVDAVIVLGERLAPVDSKFPLENFRRVIEAPSDEDRKPLKRKFTADVKKHIDAIADKYILPDEGTYDFALMYIPAENVYYEVIVKDDGGDGEMGAGGSLTEYALRRRVIPVSPNSFYAYLQAIILGLKGFQIEENAKAIMQNLSRLQGDFQRFRTDFEVLGKHLSSARSKYEDAEKRVDRFQDKLSSLHQGVIDSEEEAVPVRALPAAGAQSPNKSLS